MSEIPMWKSVEKSMPPNRVWVFVTDGNSVNPSWYSDGLGRWVGIAFIPTHWIPSSDLLMLPFELKQ